MASSIVQINFNFASTRSEYEAACAASAPQFAAMPGLNWKIWLMNEADREAGGLYLFDDAEAAQGFAQQVAGMLAEFGFANVSIKLFEPIETLTAITRGPITPRATSFGRMAAAATAQVPTITPAAAYDQIERDPSTLVIDVRDAADIAQTGTIPGAINLSYGALTYLADNEVPDSWRDPRLADRSRAIITTCILGPLGALGGKLLTDMGFSDVKILEGGVQGWLDAGLPVAKNGSA
ncbi:MAG: YdhR family protein [Anaerolineae bacterium]|jgi:rhodanese-related sulfurtransferase|nr:YdhR family protein [Anaerolineae bacterium]